MNQNQTTPETKPAARLSGVALCKLHFEEAAKAHAAEQAKAAAAAPKPAADTGKGGPWARLAAKTEKEGYTPENIAEYDRLAAIDDQKKAESQQRWDRIRARVRASEAAAAAKAPSAGKAGAPAKPKATWAEKVRAAARV